MEDNYAIDGHEKRKVANTENISGGWSNEVNKAILRWNKMIEGEVTRNENRVWSMFNPLNVPKVLHPQSRVLLRRAWRNRSWFPHYGHLCLTGHRSNKISTIGCIHKKTVDELWFPFARVCNRMNSLFFSLCPWAYFVALYYDFCKKSTPHTVKFTIGSHEENDSENCTQASLTAWLRSSLVVLFLSVLTSTFRNEQRVTLLVCR